MTGGRRCIGRPSRGTRRRHGYWGGKGASIGGKGTEGRTAWHWAAEQGRRRVDGRAALHRATEYWHKMVAQLLAERGTNSEGKDNDGRAALHRAAEQGHKTVFRLLLGDGPEVMVKDNDGWTALHWAAEIKTGAR